MCPDRALALNLVSPLFAITALTNYDTVPELMINKRTDKARPAATIISPGHGQLFVMFLYRMRMAHIARTYTTTTTTTTMPSAPKPNEKL